MTRPIFAAVNQPVTYYAAGRKPRPAIVTALNGAGSTTLSSAASASATTISTAATAAVGQGVTIMDGAKTKQKRVSAVSGAGPFTLTVPPLNYAHNSGTTVRLEPTSLNLRVRRAQTLTNVPRQVNHNDTNVWAPR